MSRRSRIIPALLALLLILGLACNFSAPTVELPGISLATPTATPLSLPPALIETDPPAGSQVGVQQGIAFFFNQPMQRDSVESNLKMEQGDGIYTWIDDSTLTFTPLQPLPADTTITFNLVAGTKAANGLELLNTTTLAFTTAPALTLTQILPADGAVDIRTDSAVVAAFNQPVVPLGADPADLPAAFSLEPTTPGRGEWLNTSTYIFYPEPGLQGGTRYTARVNTSLQSLVGLKLEQGADWSFSTSFPRVVDALPYDDYPLGLEPQITVTFNQPMDKASVEADLRFEGPGGRVSGTFEWNENGTETVFKPSARLSRGQGYVLRVSSQSRSLNGQPVQAGIQRDYITYPDFGVSYTNPFDGGVKQYDDIFRISLTAPTKNYFSDELDQLITVNPPVTNAWISSNETEISIYGEFNPDSLYTVTVSGELQDRWGAKLGSDFTTSLRSSTPGPRLTLPYQPMLLVQPEDPRLSVQLTNISYLDLNVGTISIEEFFRISNDYQLRDAFWPRDAQAWRQITNTGTGASAYGVPLSQQGSLTPGLYFARITSGQVSNQGFGNQPLLVLASTTNLTLKIGAENVLVWAVDTTSGQPLAAKSVALYDIYGNLIANGQTDSAGLWQTQLTERILVQDTYYAVLGQPGDADFGLAGTDFNSGISPWDFDISANFYNTDDANVYLYTDRPIYRPGDTVSFRGIAKQAFNGRYSELQQQVEWRASLRDLMGNTAGELPVTFSQYGTFSGQFNLPENAMPGQWYIEVSGNPGQWGDQAYYIYFDIADYRKPEINLSIAMTPQDAIQGQALQASIRADYFFGAPANDLPFTWRLYQEREYFSIPGFESGTYSAYWLGEWQNTYWQELASGQARTGSDGAFTLDLPADLNIESTSRLTLEVTAIESGGFPLSARESVLVHPSASYPGIRAAQWVGQAGQPLGFTLTAVDLQKTPIAGKALNLSFQKVTWQIRPGDETNPYPRFDRILTPQATGRVTTNASGLAETEFTPASPGTYLLRAELDGNASESLIWVGGMGQTAWPATPYDQLYLQADRESYRPGQTASIFIPNPFNTSARALISVERGKILSARVVEIATGGASIDLPLSDNEAPNAFVSVTLLGPGYQFRQGYTNLTVEPLNFVLNVDLQVSPEQAGPGETVRISLSVKDSAGQPVQGEFSLAVVDLAALALADPNAPEIVPAFYGNQPLAIKTGLTNAVYSQRLIPVGGGMGGGGGEMGITIREDFPDTALWTTFTTDANGTASLELSLPDSLTTWQIDTRGLDLQTRVGGARINLVTRKDLLLRPITPRYLVVGDRARISTYVNNNTASDLNAEVTLKANGAVLEDEKTANQRVNVPANGRALVSWWVKAGDATAADFIFSVKAGNLTDTTRPNDGAIPIVRYTAPQAFVTAGVLPAAGTQTELVSLPRSFTPLGGDLTIELSPSLGTYLLEAATSLPEPDQFASNETIASYLLANLALVPALREAGIPAAELAARENNIQVWAGRLAAQQNNDGGWNWYRRGSWGEYLSDPILSAHATYALGLVEQAYPGKHEFTIQTAKQYLSDQIVFDLDTPNLNLDEQAFLLLAYYGTPMGQAQGSLETASLTSTPRRMPIDELFERRERLSPLGQAYLALAFLGNDSPEPAKILLGNLAATANRTASGAFWENPGAGWRLPGSPVYTTAVIVHVMGRSDPASPLLVDAVRYLAANRSATRDWGGSIQNAWVLRALSSALVGTGEFAANFPFSVRLNSLEIARGEASSQTSVSSLVALERLHPANPNELLIERQGGSGKLYYRAILNVLRPVESAPAINQGIAIQREYLDCSVTPCQPVQAWQMETDAVGKLTVRLTVSLPHDMYYLNVEDFAPAGAEIVNPGLKTSEQGQETLDVEYFAPEDPYANGWGWWYFDTPRIYSDHIQWTSDYLPAGTYVLSYTLIPSLPGEYRALPAHAWMTFFPEVQGTSSGSVFEIRE